MIIPAADWPVPSKRLIFTDPLLYQTSSIPAIESVTDKETVLPLVIIEPLIGFVNVICGPVVSNLKVLTDD